MNMSTEIAVVEIKPEQAPTVFIPGGLDAYLEQIRSSVNEVPDLSTKKGRDRIASLAAQVSRSKTAIEKPGREYLKRLKEAVKPAEAEIKRFVDACDALRDLTRKPLTEWEHEQERIAAENQMLAWHEEALEMNAAFDKSLAERIDSDHEIALLLNDKFDRDLADAKAKAERQRIVHEEELKRQAEEQVRREAAAAAQREIDAAAAREREALLAKERAEREWREAIEAERRKAQEGMDRIKREAEAKEAARMAEEKRIADESAARSADVEHRRVINRSVVADLAVAGIPEEFATQVVRAIASGNVRNAKINY
ncbi:hypothetical protein HLB27_19680 [Dickeya dadantii]|uniref:hypothetical protein n=1 Tax=Dickeya dadantii TaxID=204038 RepID=UPI001495CDB5|nr:hypothetical protein [Dickeya dadantii]NPE58668.1 hypothetical protein [Dickeya dadantii]NPE72561.1 hypothetical protein [Dickeya dadantii]